MPPTQVSNATVAFINRPFLHPLELSTGTIREISEARATVTVRCGDQEATGQGSIYLSDLWAWPDPSLTHEEKDAILRGLTLRIAGEIQDLCGPDPGHPLELGLRLHENICHRGAFGDLPALALAMCASPFDAAIHDGAGLALGRSAFDFYSRPAAIPSADRYFSGGSAVEAIRSLIQSPKNALDAWLIVNKSDSLEVAVLPWIRDRGYRCFKLKIAGRDNDADVKRTVEIYRFARSHGVREPRLSVDSNEGNPSAGSVLDYLQALRDADREAFGAVEYLEQPTARDIVQHAFDWHPVSQLKPILLDEGLTSLNLLPECRRQGWGGLALKTCKGHSFALTAAAWAHENQFMFALQDLTNPGLSMIHAALMAARIHPVNGVELNSPQFTPQANEDWMPRLGSLFEPRDGYHRLPDPFPPGLGSTW